MSSVPDVSSTAPDKPNFFQKNKVWLVIVLLLILSNLGVYFYQRMQQDKLVAMCRVQLDDKYKQGEAMTLQRSVEIATDLCRTMVFGIRGEMERANKGQIELFINNMVQESGLDLVVIQDANDSIYLSTDKKYENQQLPYIEGLVTKEQVLRSDLNEVVVVSPIMGTEKRLGTLLILYKAQQPTQESLQKLRLDSLPGERKEPAQ